MKKPNIVFILTDDMGAWAMGCAGEQPGRSFAELLRTGKDDGREHVVVFDEYGPTRMIRTRAWKYIHRYPEGPNELYDLVKDPGEETNLVDDPAQAERVEQMRTELIDWFEQYIDPKYDGSKLPVTGSGQLDFADRPNAFEPDWRPDWYETAAQLKEEIHERYPEKKDYIFNR